MRAHLGASPRYVEINTRLKLCRSHHRNPIQKAYQGHVAIHYFTPEPDSGKSSSEIAVTFALAQRRPLLVAVYHFIYHVMASSRAHAPTISAIKIVVKVTDHRVYACSCGLVTSAPITVSS